MTTGIIDWYEITSRALESLWYGFLGFIPSLVGALMVFIIGWFIAVWIGKLISEVLIRIKFNQIFETGSWKKVLEKAEIKISPAGFIGEIVKWTLLIVFLMATVEILGFDRFAEFLTDVIGYLGNVVVAAFLLVGAALFAGSLAQVF